MLNTYEESESEEEKKEEEVKQEQSSDDEEQGDEKSKEEKKSLAEEVQTMRDHFKLTVMKHLPVSLGKSVMSAL